ncbi:hypothetical protein F5884DRAFT_20133 [Xylogone sp. PMI_703]|nr:hypothetical protein F5884DRAFT_20133 [Xylogone sp. PMI_703]
MTDTSVNKRKAEDDDRSKKGVKRSKGGGGGKWLTPHHQAKKAAWQEQGNSKTIEPGDVGIWATCARGQERRATDELKNILEDYAERFYDLTGNADAADDKDDEDEKDDIEASIQKEVRTIGKKERPTDLFKPVQLDLQCVLFVKSRPPVEPVDFVHRICKEIVSKGEKRRSRYLNRLIPMTRIGKATEKGIEEVGRAVLEAHFELASKGDADSAAIDKGESVTGESEDGDKIQRYAHAGIPFTYAIRPTIRNHSALKRDAVIKQVASLVGDKHRVDLTKPDKVIIIEIYQTVCGMSVVDGDWESLRRFNLSELYQAAAQA